MEHAFTAAGKPRYPLKFWGFMLFNVVVGGGFLVFLGLIVTGGLPPMSAISLLMMLVLLVFINGSWFVRPDVFIVTPAEIVCKSRLKTTRIQRKDIAGVRVIDRLPTLTLQSGFAFLPIWGYHSKHYTFGSERFVLISRGERELVEVKLHNGQRYWLGPTDAQGFTEAVKL